MLLQTHFFNFSFTKMIIKGICRLRGKKSFDNFEIFVETFCAMQILVNLYIRCHTLHLSCFTASTGNYMQPKLELLATDRFWKKAYMQCFNRCHNN